MNAGIGVIFKSIDYLPSMKLGSYVAETRTHLWWPIFQHWGSGNF